MKQKNDPSAGIVRFQTRCQPRHPGAVRVGFQAWTDPKQMTQLVQPGMGGMPERRQGCEDRRRVSSCCRQGFPEGDHIAVGEYKEIIPNQRLQFTWERAAVGHAATLVTVDFEDLGKTTRLTLTHEGFNGSGRCAMITTGLDFTT